MKHWVYELCIQQCFNAFCRNFSTTSKLHNVKIGDTFNSIIISPSTEQEIIYYSPEVVDVAHDFFTIAGLLFDEKITEDEITEVFSGDDYRVGIYPADSIVKYIL